MVKLFESEFSDFLERDINNFINRIGKNNIINISHSSCCSETGNIIFSALVYYKRG